MIQNDAVYFCSEENETMLVWISSILLSSDSVQCLWVGCFEDMGMMYIAVYQSVFCDTISSWNVKILHSYTLHWVETVIKCDLQHKNPEVLNTSARLNSFCPLSFGIVMIISNLTVSSSYGLGKEEAESYVLCDTIGSTGNHQWRTEGFRVVGDNEKPLLLQSLWKPREGLARRFEIQKRSLIEEKTSKDKDTITAGTV